MDDFEGSLNRVLNDPESMQKIFNIAQSLGISSPNPSPENSDTSQAQTASLPDASSLNFLSQLMQNSTTSDSRHTELLNALRPFLRPERQQSLDRAIRVARLSHLARFALTNLSDSP